jgi:crotonobetainyl-CoA:carnitine CoA-transferase CaiB-like acyl-CoA transferase
MVKLPSLPFEIDGKAPALRLQPPLMGQDTDDILASLGYTVEQIAALRAQGKVK